MAIMKIPFNIFKNILAQVGERAAEINDVKMNQLMGRLTIYGVCAPDDKENYNAEICKKVLAGETGIDAAKLAEDKTRLEGQVKQLREALSKLINDNLFSPDIVGMDSAQKALNSTK
jgi:hypothetical protein